MLRTGAVGLSVRSRSTILVGHEPAGDQCRVEMTIVNAYVVNFSSSGAVTVGTHQRLGPQPSDKTSARMPSPLMRCSAGLS